MEPTTIGIVVCVAAACIAAGGFLISQIEEEITKKQEKEAQNARRCSENERPEKIYVEIPDPAGLSARQIMKFRAEKLKPVVWKQGMAETEIAYRQGMHDGIDMFERATFGLTIKDQLRRKKAADANVSTD